MHLFTILSFINAFLNIGLGSFVYLSNNKKLVNIYFFLLTASICVWNIGYGTMYSVSNLQSAFIFAKIGTIGIILIPLFSHLFVNELINSKNQKLNLFILFLTIALIIVLLFNKLYSGVSVYSWGKYPVADSFNFLNIVFYFFVFSLICVRLIIKIKEVNVVEKARLRYYLIAFFIGLFGFVDWIPNYFPNYHPLAFVLSFGWVMIITFSILKHNLLDIDVLLKRSTYFLILFLLVILPFVMFVNFMTSQLFINQENYRYLLVACIWTIFIIFSEYIKEWMKNVTDTLFYIADYNYEKVLDRVNKKLSEITDIYFLLYSLNEDIVKYLKVENAGIFLPNKTKTKYYYVELERLDDFIDTRKRTALFSISESHPIVHVMQRVEGNIIVREELLNSVRHKEDVDIREALSVMDIIEAEAMIGSIFKNKINGILAVAKKKSGDRFKTKDLRLLKFMVNQGTLVLMRIFEIEEKTKIFIEKKMHIAHKKELEEKNDQLREALIELKEAQNKLIEEEQLSAMGKLSGEVAHDIRNPLSAMNRLFTYVKQEDMIKNNERVILNLYELIEKKNFEEKRKVLKSLKYLLVNNKEINSVIEETIQINDKLRKIANDFLDYSRTSRDIPFEKIKLIAILEKIISQFQSSEEIVKNGIVLSIPEVFDVSVVMFEHQVQKIFMNIIDNAIKAVIDNEKDTKEIIIKSYGTRISNRDVICISIQDNGIGIPVEHLNSIFKPFYTKRKNLTGTGLGLAIVKKIIEDAKGEITVESNQKEGTTFKVFLPFYE